MPLVQGQKLNIGFDYGLAHERFWGSDNKDFVLLKY